MKFRSGAGLIKRERAAAYQYFLFLCEGYSCHFYAYPSGMPISTLDTERFSSQSG